MSINQCILLHSFIHSFIHSWSCCLPLEGFLLDSACLRSNRLVVIVHVSSNFSTVLCLSLSLSLSYFYMALWLL